MSGDLRDRTHHCQRKSFFSSCLSLGISRALRDCIEVKSLSLLLILTNSKVCLLVKIPLLYCLCQKAVCFPVLSKAAGLCLVFPAAKNKQGRLHSWNALELCLPPDYKWEKIQVFYWIPGFWKYFWKIINGPFLSRNWKVGRSFSKELW